MTDSQAVNIIQFAKNYPVARIIVNSLTLFTLVLFLISLISPLFTLEKFYFFSNTVSLFSALLSLIDKGHLFLFLIIFIFSILFPVFKLAVILYLWNSHAGAIVQRLLRLIHQFGKWSMLDVLVVALMVVSIKFDAVADMQIHYGLYLFLGSVILSMLISAASTRFLENHIEFNSLKADG
ncbi:MAG: paraquat-inducible protein A [gamma proteobacterium symbiont of Bathyaustriella thionipta]|nr:paraquat-inducible protein A [gamma proteobacterium symbiont of Bathyaustriella thionipta]MCU7950665.1 paraquat-inducible protein A [gamma proteobacterium symbiont of Bathyaustriella thionipta]MCU7954011.1 paraquat-inducible protein A [gamma proteobacterium symbiont of Bathyaustriella thionipta]MCU7957874.1 paraquat-inducible protein A [gamma proteobacterium symbiont of Bathyaustriella thionipta]MCU7967523.1 paraquat-inducible protein A [gamma proteobacterium symbiont of Bathyaustriella thio